MSGLSHIKAVKGERSTCCKAERTAGRDLQLETAICNNPGAGPEGERCGLVGDEISLDIEHVKCRITARPVCIRKSLGAVIFRVWPASQRYLRF